MGPAQGGLKNGAQHQDRFGPQAFAHGAVRPPAARIAAMAGNGRPAMECDIRAPALAGRIAANGWQYRPCPRAPVTARGALHLTGCSPYLGQHAPRRSACQFAPSPSQTRNAVPALSRNLAPCPSVAQPRQNIGVDIAIGRQTHRSLPRLHRRDRCRADAPVNACRVMAQCRQPALQFGALCQR